MSFTIPCADAIGQILTPAQAAEAAAPIEALVFAEGTLSLEEPDTSPVI